MKMLERIWVILLVLGSASSVAAETHRFDPELGYQTYKVREPVLRVRPGDIVETSTLFSPLFVQREGAWPGEVGPIYIEGATPEDEQRRSRDTSLRPRARLSNLQSA